MKVSQQHRANKIDNRMIRLAMRLSDIVIYYLICLHNPQIIENEIRIRISIRTIKYELIK